MKSGVHPTSEILLTRRKLIFPDDRFILIKCLDALESKIKKVAGLNFVRNNFIN